MSFLFNNTQGFVVGLFTLVIAGAMMAYVFLRKKEEEVAMITPAALLTSSSLTESTSSQPDGERKEESDLYEGKYHEQTTNSDTEEVVMTPALLRIVNHGYSLSWFKHRVFPYLGPKQEDIIQLRSYCKLFRDSLDPPLWTSFPHPNYPTLNELMDALNRVYEENPTKAPTIVFLMEGTFHGNGFVHMNYPLMMIGAGRNKTFLDGYNLFIGGTKEEGKEVVVQDMTISSRAGCTGLSASNGLSFLCKDMTFTQCGHNGVFAENTKGRLINCVITQCGYSGIFCGENALIEVEGDQTKVDGNGTSGYIGCYGLCTDDTSSIIHLLFPLTKESVATNNNGNGNYNSRGTIETVDTFESL
jgi:hypothetical protein